MKRKVFLLSVATILVTAVQAQIGYKGQVTLSVNGGINSLMGYVADAATGVYISSHSILGVGAMFDRTGYDASQNDSFDATQWFGEFHYQYAVPLNKFILRPSGGFLMGAESCDPISRQGNLLPYNNQFVYGMFVEFGMEYVFCRHWALTLNPRFQYLMKTHFDKLKISGGLGLKYYF